MPSQSLKIMQGLRKHPSWVGVALVGAIAACLYLARTLEDPSSALTSRRLEQLVAEPAFRKALGKRDAGYARDMDAYILTAIRALNNKYQFTLDGIGLNDTLKPNSVNLYFVRMRDLPSLARFRGTCTFLGVRNAIFCDLDFIDQMQSPPQQLSQESDARYREMFDAMVRAGNANVLLWLLGHELGHLAHRHGAHDFTGSGATGRVDYWARFNDPKEQAADLFSIELFDDAGLDPKYGRTFGFMLNRGFHALINKLGNEILTDNSLPRPLLSYDGPIPIRVGSLRDTLFARALNMQLLVIKKYDIESPGYYESIKKRIAFRD